MLDIKIELTKTPKELPGKDNPLKFGTIFTDHMFVMNYEATSSCSSYFLA